MAAIQPYLTFAGLGTQDAEQDEGLFAAMAAASVAEDGGGGGGGGGKGEASDEDSSDEDEEDTPERVQNAARLLAGLVSGDGGGSGGALDPDPDTPALLLPSRLLSAHCCHGCFSSAQIGTLVDAAERHVAIHGWLTKRHSQHPTTDFSLHDAPLAWAAAEPTVSGVVLPTLHRLYFGGSTGTNGSGGATLTINDLFYVRYDGSTDGAQRELEAHRDGSLLSFSIALTEPCSFAGGGTRFVGDGRVLRPERAGDLVAHSGKVLHAGEPVTAGRRDILVGFVTVAGPAVNEVFLASHMVTKAQEHPRLDAPIVNGALVATALAEH